MSRKRRKALPTSWAVSLASGLIVLAIWEMIVQLGFVRSLYLPPPSSLAAAFADLIVNGYGGASLAEQIWRSVVRVFTGYVTAVVVGVPVGLLMGHSKFLQRVIDPVLHTYRPIPPIAYIPLLIIWFGIGELPKVILIFLTVLPIVILNTFDGVLDVPQTRLRAAYALGASGWRIFFFVIFPGSLTSIATGLRIGIGSAWIAVVAAEMIAADSGAGWMVLDASRYLRTDIVVLGILIIGLIGFCLDQGFRMLEAWLVPWRGKG